MPDTSRATVTLPVLPLPDGVVLPDTVVTVALETGEARTAGEATRAAGDRVLLVPRVDGRFAAVGVVGAVEDRGRLPGGTPALTIRALHRARVGTGVLGPAGAPADSLWVDGEPVPDGDPTAEHEELAAGYRAVAATLLDRVGGRRFAGALRAVTAPGALADSIAHWPELSLPQRVELLETVDVAARLRLATGWAREALAELELRERIRQEVAADLDRAQREAILRRQIAAIRKELDDGADASAGYRARLEAADLPPAVATAAAREIDRLERSGDGSAEAGWIRTWLDTVLEIPWSVRTTDATDLAAARRLLDEDHDGLEDVKQRLVEHLAVRRFRAERGTPDGTDAPDGGGGGSERRRGVILALVGPPGVGKTSLGESVARALGRRFVRLALGGIRDEAEIRGHRRTYVGARPGRVVRALIESGSMNPVVLLDEVDKVGADWRGDPSAALLEVLDPAQNHSFRDHYLEFELDLSDVVFVATANVLDTIPAPLLDRLEVITVDGYTEHEKAGIARRHLLPRVERRHGLVEGELVVPDDVLAAVVADWTREAGVRRLERLLERIARKVVTRLAEGSAEAPYVVRREELRDLLGRPAPREATAERVDRPGIATGLAVTGAGGDVLFVETALVDGAGEPVLTGQLGDVMKESAVIARSVVAGVARRWGLPVPEGRRFHVHVPAGAVPKDGPSAGITMTTALVSLLSGRRVRPEVGMTGEVTLQGRVLPIGGVRQKVLAAHRAGLRTVILPAGNGEDLDDVPAEVREDLAIHLVRDVDEVLALALEPAA